MIEHQSVVAEVAGGLARLTDPVLVTLLGVGEVTVIFTLEGGECWGGVLSSQTLGDAWK